MGKSAARRLGEEEPSSIKDLRQVVEDLQSCLETVGRLTDEFPDILSLENLVTNLEQNDLCERLKNLRNDLKEDREDCEELEREIMGIETEYEEKEVLETLAGLVMDIRDFGLDTNNDAKRNKASRSRKKFRKHVSGFAKRLNIAIDTRCDPSSRRAS